MVEIRARVAVGVVAIALVLTGCAPQSSDPGSSPSQGSSKPATAQPDEEQTLADLECSDLIPDSSVKQFNAAVAPIDSTHDLWDGNQVIAHYATEQRGGINCSWGNTPQETAEFVGITARVLPNAEAVWDTQYPLMTAKNDAHSLTGGPLATYGEASAIDCAEFGNGDFYGDCSYNVLVNGYWLYLRMHNEGGTWTAVDAPDAAILADAVALLATLGSTEPVNPAPAGSLEAPTTCVGLLPVATIRAALGENAVIEDFSYASSLVFIDNAAVTAEGGLFCNWRAPLGWLDSDGRESYLGVAVTILPDSAWAKTGAMPTQDLLELSYAPVAGLGDSAWSACGMGGWCAAHVFADGAWISVQGGYRLTSPAPVESVAASVLAALG